MGGGSVSIGGRLSCIARKFRFNLGAGGTGSWLGAPARITNRQVRLSMRGYRGGGGYTAPAPSTGGGGVGVGPSVPVTPVVTGPSGPPTGGGGTPATGGGGSPSPGGGGGTVGPAVMPPGVVGMPAPMPRPAIAQP